MIDMTEPAVVEVSINHDKSIVWVNVDGVCAFRACRIKNLVIDDRSGQLPEEYISADTAADMLNLSKKTFLNLSYRGDIPKCEMYNGKKVWVRSQIEETARSLKGEL